MKVYEVTFSDGSTWHVPAEFIAYVRALYYAKLDYERGDVEDYNQAVKDEMEYALKDTFELCDFAANNMNWSDVKDRAIQMAQSCDYDKEWTNAQRKVIEVEIDSSEEMRLPDDYGQTK